MHHELVKWSGNGVLETLCRSPGGKAVDVLRFGPCEEGLRGQANFNSALGARNPDAFVRRKERKAPVLMLIAGIHGHEVEGMVGVLSVARLMATGTDLLGRPWPELHQALLRLRLILLPLANPDGRARVPYNGWVGLPTKEMTRWGQGTRSDGSYYGHPGCKAVHPMAGDVGILGGYYDDRGVNMMHDEWSAPMSETTRALLRLARDEAPDLILCLHSFSLLPTLLRLAYVPLTVKQEMRRFSDAVNRRFDARGITHGPAPVVSEDGPPGEVAPALNLTSMLYHTSGGLGITFESPHGLADGKGDFDYTTILTLHHLLFETAAFWLNNG